MRLQRLQPGNVRSQSLRQTILLQRLVHAPRKLQRLTIEGSVKVKVRLNVDGCRAHADGALGVILGKPEEHFGRRKARVELVKIPCALQRLPRAIKTALSGIQMCEAKKSGRIFLVARRFKEFAFRSVAVAVEKIG